MASSLGSTRRSRSGLVAAAARYCLWRQRQGARPRSATRTRGPCPMAPLVGGNDLMNRTWRVRSPHGVHDKNDAPLPHDVLLCGQLPNVLLTRWGRELDRYDSPLEVRGLVHSDLRFGPCAYSQVGGTKGRRPILADEGLGRVA